ncbi:MAG: PmoA family protein, partial [Phycisphaerales bacterium]
EGRKDLAAHGQKTRWMGFSGRFAQGKTAGMAIFDHPNNLRHPELAFVIMDPKVPFGYFGPALLFNKPYTLPAGKSLMLRYRVLVHPGRLDANSLEREWQSFRFLIEKSATGNRQPVPPVSTIHLQFNRQMPFAEALDRIRNCVEPPLQIAVLWRDLYDNADIDRTTPINMDEISGVSVGTALELLLASVSGRYDLLGYVIDDGVIIIATVESLPNTLKARVYDISDLL